MPINHPVDRRFLCTIVFLSVYFIRIAKTPFQSAGGGELR